MAKQIGRRSPCHCGSGARYKNCCEKKDRGEIPGIRVQKIDESTVSPEVQEFVRRARAQPAAVTANSVPWVLKDGRRMVAGKACLHARPREEAFSNFLVHHLKWTLGRDWFDAQIAKPAAEQDQISVLLRGLYDWQVENMQHPERRVGRGWLGPPSGLATAAMTLAYDVYCLERIGALPPRLLNRLKDPLEFQGARYEIAVAAIFRRAGCGLEWTTPGPGRRCEFIASHEDTKERAGVEAKSRRRPGILGHPGTANPDAPQRVDVEHLIDDALAQAPDELIPFVVFIDVNQPPLPAQHPLDLPWFPGLPEYLESKSKGTPADPDSFTAFVVTNYSHHWLGTAKVPDSIEYILSLAKFSKRPSLSPQLMGDLLASLQSYGRIPTPWVVE